MGKRRFTPQIQVIIIFGLISMLGDMIYETARGANGQYLKLMGRDIAEISLLFGIGEFLGYFLRIISGIFSDKTRNPWPFIFLGYGSLIVIPIMGLTTRMGILGTIILLERVGKALRSPSKDTLISSVAKDQVGTGFAFGLQEFLDQLGAFSGPLIFSLVFIIFGKSSLNEYQLAYKALIIPYLILMAFLYFSYTKITGENLIGELNVKEYKKEKLSKSFYLYTAFTFFTSLGFLNFPLMAVHIKNWEVFNDATITSLYSLAMAVDALAAILIGRAYDLLKKRGNSNSEGLKLLLGLPLLTFLLSIFALGKTRNFIYIAIIIFGLIMGAHETIMRSAIADITPFSKRGTGYGVFNTFYGLALMAGSIIFGRIYNITDRNGLIIFTGIVEIIALIIFIALVKNIREEKNEG